MARSIGFVPPHRQENRRDDASNHRRPTAAYANRLRRVDRGRLGKSLRGSHSFCMHVYRVNTTFQKAVALQLYARRY